METSDGAVHNGSEKGEWRRDYTLKALNWNSAGRFCAFGTLWADVQPGFAHQRMSFVRFYHDERQESIWSSTAKHFQCTQRILM